MGNLGEAMEVVSGENGELKTIFPNIRKIGGHLELALKTSTEMKDRYEGVKLRTSHDALKTLNA